MNANPPDDRPGQRFQNFVATLERMFAHREGVSVDSPLRLRDKDTGKLREHDVVITSVSHHGPSLTAIECKDQGRKVGVQQVEGFSRKCEKTGIHRGIIVSASGFADTARTKARALNITCMELAEAENFEWIGDVTVISQVYNFTKIEIYVRAADIANKLIHPFTVYDSNDQPHSGEGVQSFLLQELPREATEPPCPRSGSITASGDDFYVIDAKGERFPVKDMTFIYELFVERTEQPMIFHSYAGEDATMEIASSETQIPAGSTTLAFVKDKDGAVWGHILAKGTTDYLVQIGDGPRRYGSSVPRRFRRSHPGA